MNAVYSKRIRSLGEQETISLFVAVTETEVILYTQSFYVEWQRRHSIYTTYDNYDRQLVWQARRGSVTARCSALNPPLALYMTAKYLGSRRKNSVTFMYFISFSLDIT